MSEQNATICDKKLFCVTTCVGNNSCAQSEPVRDKKNGPTVRLGKRVHALLVAAIERMHREKKVMKAASEFCDRALLDFLKQA